VRQSPEFAALIDMIEEHATFSENERKAYAAYVLPTSPVGDAVISANPRHVPPLTNSIKVDTSSGVAKDAASGRPVKLWTVKLREVQGDHAIVQVTWYSGSLSSGMHRIELDRVDGKWRVVKRVLEVIS